MVCLAVLFACGHATPSKEPESAPLDIPVASSLVVPVVKPPVLASQYSCHVDGDDVAFRGLSLRATVLANEPFARVTRAAHAMVGLPAGKKESLRLDLETASLRLFGFSDADNVPFFPAEPSLFGQMVIPLNNGGLDWSAVNGASVQLLPNRPPSAFMHIEVEARPCSFLKIKPQPPFNVGEAFHFHRHRKLHLPAGGYALFATPEADGSGVTLYLSGSEDTFVIEEQPKWMRIVWENGDTVAFVGWIEKPPSPGGSIGHGFGTGMAMTRGCIPSKPVCSAELTLFVESGGVFSRNW
jgi:hypothetical protein